MPESTTRPAEGAERDDARRRASERTQPSTPSPQPSSPSPAEPSETAIGAGTAKAPRTVRRTQYGWRVSGDGGEEFPDLVNAMVLADLLVAEDGTGQLDRPLPPRATGEEPEVERLRVTVAQLEHALHTRIVIEQAIGVLAERHRVSPRTAFERLRLAARSRGRKVVDLAAAVVSSSTQSVAIPAELERSDTG